MECDPVSDESQGHDQLATSSSDSSGKYYISIYLLCYNYIYIYIAVSLISHAG